MHEIAKTTRRSVNWLHRTCSLLVALSLLLSLTAVIPLVRADDEPPRAYPALLKMAEERPNEMLKVIVQRRAQTALPEQALAHLGGKVTKDLPIINGFAMELPARAVEALARHPGVRWVSLDAPVVSTAVGSYTFRDEFTAISYSGSNGSEAWSSPWTEQGESDGSGNGKVRVVASATCALVSCLRLGGFWTDLNGIGVYRSVNLANATAATLTYSYRRTLLGYEGGSVRLQVSPDGGLNWTTLATYQFTGSDSGQAAQTFDITPYATSSTQIRFVGSGSVASLLYVDNVQIEYTRLANAYIQSVGADRLWKEFAGLPGQGVTVAVVDSGIASHGDLQAAAGSRVLASVNLSGSADAGDQYGHGTHVAGIIGGSGSASAGARIGVAPGVNLLDVKVSDGQGMSLVSDVVSGLQWIYDNRLTYNIRIVNISLNSTVPESYNTSPLSAAVETLWFNGIVVVVSAGNNGTGSGPVSLYPPANDPFVITVGAVDNMGTAGLSDDAVPAFSAYGTTEDGFAKPDLVAPGRNLISLLASTSATLYVEHAAHRVDSNYFRMSGTSVAAPVVSGAAALLLQDEPYLTPDQVKQRLKATASTAWPGYDAAKAGAGTLNAYAAVTGATTESANTGIAASLMLWTGTDPVAWDSVSWNSVSWNSVSWNSVSWNSVSWNSVSWNSVSWNSSLWDD